MAKTRILRAYSGVRPLVASDDDPSGRNVSRGIVLHGKSYVISKDGKPGPICTKLYNKLRGIQYGDEPDTHGWVTIVE